MPPKISVLMPVYNAEAYLAEAIRSILEQTYRDFEFIILNDGSTDGSAGIIARFQQEDARIRCYQQENLGLIDTLNKGLDLASGKYVARMDADDIAMPERLAQQTALMEADPDIVISSSNISIIDSAGKELRLSYLPGDDTAIRWRMLFRCSFAHPGVMLRADILRANRLYYAPQGKHAEDYELWSRLLDFGQGRNLKEVLVKRRIHRDQASVLHQAQQAEKSEQISKHNLEKIGVDVSFSELRKLKAWSIKFPAKLGVEDTNLCSKMLEIVRAFSAQAGLNPGSLRLIRGRWLLKILLARPAGGVGHAWKLDLLRYLSPGDFFSLLTYLRFYAGL